MTYPAVGIRLNTVVALKAYLPGECAMQTARSMVGAILVVLLGAGDVQAASGHEDTRVEAHAAERGFFVDPARKTALSLRYCGRTDVCVQEYLLQHEDGPIATTGYGGIDLLNTQGVCRDVVTGLDHVLIYYVHSSGKYSEVRFWSVDPASGEVQREYEEAWYGLEDGMPMADRNLLVDADGRCLWRERQQGRAVLQNVLSTLHVGQDAAHSLPEGGTTALPVRELPVEVARQQLLALDAVRPRMARFETAVYADEAGRTAWRVIQMTGTVLYETPGVVLVEDRRTETWRALYDVIGDRYGSPLAAQFMVVTGNTLTAELSSDSWWGEYGCFNIDLLTNRVTSLNESVCAEMRELHYPGWDEYDPAGEKKPFDLRKDLDAD